MILFLFHNFLLLIKKEFNLEEKDKSLCMNFLLHAADISNPIKPFPIYFKWTEKILDEFWIQVKKNKKFIIYSLNLIII